jgi:NADH-quinone oxidoreductase subunit F
VTVVAPNHGTTLSSTANVSTAQWAEERSYTNNSSTLSTVVRRCGGTRPDRKFKAAFSGIANAVLTPDRFPTPLTYEAMTAAGSGLGAGGFVFYDDSACMVEVARAFSRFLYVESCGQCRSCKFGCGEITRALERIEAGHGVDVDIEYIGRRLQTVTDSVRCYLANEEQITIASILREFSDEFAEHLEGRCRVPVPRPIIVPKIVDIVDEVVVYDEKQARKQPDWTYAEA